MASTSGFDVFANIRGSHQDYPSTRWFRHDFTEEIELSTRLDFATAAELPLILTILLKTPEYDRALEGHLLKAFPDFPTHLLRRLYESVTDGQGSVVLPSLSDTKSLTFLANYPRIETPSPANGRHGGRHGTKSGQTPVRFVPVLCWCSSVDYTTHHPTPQDRPTQVGVVVLLAFDEQVISKMKDFWTLPKRGERLARFQQWAFLDLAVALSDWPVIWANARRELANLHNSMYSTNNAAIADLSTTRIIYQDTATIISLREELRLFIAAHAKLQHVLRRVFRGGTGAERVERLWNSARHLRNQLDGNADPNLAKKTEITKLETWLNELENRLEDAETNLDHQLETSEVILRQLENLLNLTFSTQAIAQGQSMATLNLMATVFLPLSFVASVFGMTQFDISAAWYPLAAFVVLCLVAAALFKLSPFSLQTGSGRSQRSSNQPTFNLLNPSKRSSQFWKWKLSPTDAGISGSSPVRADDEIMDTALSLLPVTDTTRTPEKKAPGDWVGPGRPSLLRRISILLAAWRRPKSPPVTPQLDPKVVAQPVPAEPVPAQSSFWGDRSAWTDARGSNKSASAPHFAGRIPGGGIWSPSTEHLQAQMQYAPPYGAPVDEFVYRSQYYQYPAQPIQPSTSVPTQATVQSPPVLAPIVHLPSH